MHDHPVDHDTLGQDHLAIHPFLWAGSRRCSMSPPFTIKAPMRNKITGWFLLPFSPLVLILFYFKGCQVSPPLLIQPIHRCLKQDAHPSRLSILLSYPVVCHEGYDVSAIVRLLDDNSHVLAGMGWISVFPRAWDLQSVLCTSIHPSFLPYPLTHTFLFSPSTPHAMIRHVGRIGEARCFMLFPKPSLPRLGSILSGGRYSSTS